MTRGIDIPKYKQLFVHRDDVFAQQFPDGHYEPVREPLTDDDIQEHLAGLASYGTYVIRPEDQTVKFVVFDLDTNDENDLELLIKSVWKLIESIELIFPEDHLLVEVSGRKGWHVWLFFTEPLPAAQVRRWLNKDFKSPVPGLEVFPKQDKVADDGYGNLVKLPFGIHAVTNKRSRVNEKTGIFTEMDSVKPIPSPLVPDYPPEHATMKKTNSAGGATPFACVNHIMQGVGEGNRDNAMFHLAAYWKGHGLEQDLAYEACLRCNALFLPPLDETIVYDKVSSAYGGSTRQAGCGASWLQGFCPGPCPNRKEDTRSNLAHARTELAAWLADK